MPSAFKTLAAFLLREEGRGGSLLDRRGPGHIKNFNLAKDAGLLEMGGLLERLR